MERERWMFLVPIDFTEASDHALAEALRSARRCFGHLVLAHVVGRSLLVRVDDETARLQREEARVRLEALRDEIVSHGIPAEAYVFEGPVAGTLLELITRLRPDTVVMGTHDWGALHRAFVGSVSQRVCQESDAPVLLVRAPRRPQLLAEQSGS
jgi:nucleotide-binding universal stress UspA family protein